MSNEEREAALQPWLEQRGVALVHAATLTGDSTCGCLFGEVSHMVLHIGCLHCLHVLQQKAPWSVAIRERIEALGGPKSYDGWLTEMEEKYNQEHDEEVPDES